MKKILLLLTVLMMFTICFAAEPAAERPVYSAGDYWVFTANDKQEVKLRFLKEEKDYYYFDRDGVQVVKDFDLTEVIKQKNHDYRGPFIKFPLTVGKVWTYDIQGDQIVPRQAGRQAKYKVAAYEQITVPAGTFWSFKITLSIYETKYWGKVFSTEYWYAPDVKQIIRFSKEGKVSQLKEYKIK